MNDKIKNIIIYNDYAFLCGGASKVAFDGAIALAKKGYNVTFLSGTGPVNSTLTTQGISCVCLEQPDLLSDKNKIRAALRGLWNIKAYRQTKKLLKQYNGQETIILVHCYSKTLSSSIFAAMKNTDFKVIYTLHDYFTACPNGGFYDYHHQKLCNVAPLSLECIFKNCDSRSYLQKLYRLLRQVIIRLCLRNSNNIYAYNVSEMSKKLMEPYVAHFFKVYDTLLNPVDINKSEIEDMPDNGTYLYIGRLSKEKGADDFCKVITELGLQGEVLGDGYMAEDLKRAYPNISFKGWVDGNAKIEEVRKAKCVIFPSKVHETYGLIVPESLSYGIPCIVPTGCGATSLIENGKNGFVYKMGDYEDLKKKVILMMNSDTSKLKQYIKDTFRAKDFSVDVYIDRLEKSF